MAFLTRLLRASFIYVDSNKHYASLARCEYQRMLFVLDASPILVLADDIDA